MTAALFTRSPPRRKAADSGFWLLFRLSRGIDLHTSCTGKKREGGTAEVLIPVNYDASSVDVPASLKTSLLPVRPHFPQEPRGGLDGATVTGTHLSQNSHPQLGGSFPHLSPTSAPGLAVKRPPEDRLLAGPVWLSAANIYSPPQSFTQFCEAPEQFELRGEYFPLEIA